MIFNKNLILAVFFTLQTCSPTFAAINPIRGTYAPGLRVAKNFVKNPDCEKGVFDIANSAGTGLTSNTSSPLLTDAGAQCRWNPGAAATLKFDIDTISPNLKPGNCEASFYTSSTTAGQYIAYLEYDSVKVTSNLAVNATTDGQRFSIPSPCSTTATTRKLVIESTTSPSLILIGGVSFGENLNIGTASQASWYGSISYPATANCQWNGTANSAYTNFSADTDCGTPTTAGSASAPGTKIPGITFSTLPPGCYEFIAGGLFGKTDSASGVTSFRFHDGTSALLGDNGHQSTTAISQTGGNVLGQVCYTLPQSNITIQLQGYSSAASIFPFIGVINIPFTIQVKRFPNVSELAVSVSQTLNMMGSVFYVASSTCPTGSLPADGSAVSRSGYAQLFNAIGTTFGTGDGSTTFNLPDLRGIFVRGSGSQTISSITYSGTLGTKQGDQMQGHRHAPLTATGTPGFLVNTDGAVDTASSGSNSYRDQAKDLTTGNPITDGTNGTPRTGSESRPANIALTACVSYVNVPAPLYVGSISSNTSGSLRHESALINISGASTCSISSQSGSWISSCAASSTIATLTLASGMFSAAPDCTVSTDSTASANIPVFASNSSTSVSLALKNTSNVAQTGLMHITCTGPR